MKEILPMESTVRAFKLVFPFLVLKETVTLEPQGVVRVLSMIKTGKGRVHGQRIEQITFNFAQSIAVCITISVRPRIGLQYVGGRKTPLTCPD